jgi:hypothetical protein
MIDGIKIQDLLVSSEEITNNEYLDFVGHHSITTGEERNYNKRAKYQGLSFTLKPNGVIQLDGSLHKYYNKGSHNHNDFSFSDIHDTINDLQIKFKINPEKVVLNNVEFGVNIRLPYPPKQFIKSVINHKGSPFSPMSAKIVKKGAGIECIHDQYYIKIYDKGTQYGLGENVLRIEIKVVRMAYFKNAKIKLGTLDNLKHIETYLKLKVKFLEMIDNLLVCDIDRSGLVKLSDKEKLLHAEGTNPKYWESLKPDTELKKSNHHEYERKRKNIYKIKTKFNELLIKYQLNKKKTEIKVLIIKKWDELINSEPSLTIKKRDKFTDSKEDKFIGAKKTNTGQIHTIYKIEECDNPNPTRFCLVTGADISDQQIGSKFVSANKVGYLEAHRIRNAYHDPRRNLLIRVNKYNNELTLFDMKSQELLLLTQEQSKLLQK